MGSRFNPSTTPRKSPPWCRAGLFPVAPPIIAGLAQYIVAYLRWVDADLSPPADLTASIKLPWNAEDNKWEKDQPGPGHSLGGSVQAAGAPNCYTLSLRLNTDGEMAEDHEWFDVKIGPDFPWDSRLQVLGDLELQVWA